MGPPARLRSETSSCAHRSAVDAHGTLRLRSKCLGSLRMVSCRQLATHAAAPARLREPFALRAAKNPFARRRRHRFTVAPDRLRRRNSRRPVPRAQPARPRRDRAAALNARRLVASACRCIHPWDERSTAICRRRAHQSKVRREYTCRCSCRRRLLLTHHRIASTRRAKVTVRVNIYV